MISRELAIKRAVAAGKTVVMEQADFDRWIEALRSGKYEQMQNSLANDSLTAFCCLGVEVHARCGTNADYSGGTPRMSYMAANNVIYLQYVCGESGGEWSARFGNPEIGDAPERTAAGMNDNGVSFNENRRRARKSLHAWPEE